MATKSSAIGYSGGSSLKIESTFHDSRTLREVTKRPILGMVTMLQSEHLARLRRRGSVMFVGGFGGLLASFAVVFVFAAFLSRLAG